MTIPLILIRSSTRFYLIAKKGKPVAHFLYRQKEMIFYGWTNLQEAVNQANFRIFGQQRMKKFGFNLTDSPKEADARTTKGPKKKQIDSIIGEWVIGVKTRIHSMKIALFNHIGAFIVTDTAAKDRWVTSPIP